VGGIAETSMRNRVQEAMDDPRSRNASNELKGGKISVVLRTLNESQTLRSILDDISRQEAASDTEVIVVDNESTDGTPELAKKYGATVVTLARENFTYPRSMNLGVEAASNDLVVLSVGHAKLSNRFLLAGAARHFEDRDTGGVFSRILLGTNSSRTEKWLQAAGSIYLKPASKVKKAGMGVLGATNCMISKEVWHDLGGFDEAYAMGGEDGAMAKRMLQEGLDIIEDPVIAVHHTHGLGPINYARQVRRWIKSAKPSEIDLAEVTASRPDMDFS
jgi:GT2 family glycosyltransferase